MPSGSGDNGAIGMIATGPEAPTIFNSGKR